MLFPDLTISRYPLYHKQHRRHRQLYVTARDECTALISASKTDYFRNQLEKASNKTCFVYWDRSMVSAYSNHLNSVWPPKDANGKIDNLLSGLQCLNEIYRPSDERRCFTDCIYVFDRTTSTEITTICCATKKTCVLDPLPANQLTVCIFMTNM